MQYATLRRTAAPLQKTIPIPNHGSPPRMRRNTVEGSPARRQQPMIRLIKASQQQQYAYEYIDDRSSFVRVQKAEEERIQQDRERALRAQRRNKARKAARASKAAEQAADATDDWEPIPLPDATDDWQPIPVPDSYPDHPAAHSHNSSIRRTTKTGERVRLDSFVFPTFDPKQQVQARPPPLDNPPPLYRGMPSIPSSTKRLAPLSRFNPFVRARSESLSSLIDEAEALPEKRKRNASLTALFQRIHREAEYMRMAAKQGHNAIYGQAY
ncbi:hypothetical protein C8R43DRAFT_332050 [Mycena crocata]|nr:hypothetical protein C8R43DRAFT_332050 [Mycena crocata]